MNRGARRATANGPHPARWLTLPLQAGRVAGPVRSGTGRSGARRAGTAGRVVVVPPGEVPYGAEVLGMVVLLAEDSVGPAPVPSGGQTGPRGLVLTGRAAPNAGPGPVALPEAGEPDDDVEVEVYVARDGLVIDRPGRAVRAGADVVDLTRREFDLLDHVCTRPGRVLTRDQLLAAVWGSGRPTGAGPRTVDVHVARVRRKLGPPHADALETVRGVGYRWVP